MFTISYLGSRGCRPDGEKDPSITSEMKESDKAMLVEFFKTLNLFMAVDSSLGARIAKFQQELKTKRKPKA